MNNKLIIMRGLPFAGKSYRAKELAGKNGLIFSTDDYWYEVEDKENPKIYSFNPNKLKQAHQWNRDRFEKAVDLVKPLIIVDNTNTQKREAEPYAVYAHKKGYDVFIEEPTSQHWLDLRPSLLNKDEAQLDQWSTFLANGSKETHNVPKQSIDRMMERWEEFSIEDILPS